MELGLQLQQGAEVVGALGGRCSARAAAAQRLRAHGRRKVLQGGVVVVQGRGQVRSRRVPAAAAAAAQRGRRAGGAAHPCRRRADGAQGLLGGALAVRSGPRCGEHSVKLGGEGLCAASRGAVHGGRAAALAAGGEVLLLRTLKVWVLGQLPAVLARGLAGVLGGGEGLQAVPGREEGVRVVDGAGAGAGQGKLARGCGRWVGRAWRQACRLDGGGGGAPQLELPVLRTATGRPPRSVSPRFERRLGPKRFGSRTVRRAAAPGGAGQPGVAAALRSSSSDLISARTWRSTSAATLVMLPIGQLGLGDRRPAQCRAGAKQRTWLLRFYEALRRS